LAGSNVHLHFEREVGQLPSKNADILRNPDIVLYHRAQSLDVQLSATKHTQLDKNNSLDLELSTGWNKVKSCELRVKSSTGGLRLLNTEAIFVGSRANFTQPPEVGIFYFNSIESNTAIILRFPFSIELDISTIAVRVGVTYTTDKGTFHFWKMVSVPISLALGVNVQDIFKHGTLFSRFTVSSSSSSPLRLLKSELQGSEIFDTQFGVPPADAVLVFPKQPASLLYQITRQVGSEITKTSQKTLYLKLNYVVLEQEIEAIISASIMTALKETTLWVYHRLVTEEVVSQLKTNLTPYDLERAALLGNISTSFVTSILWMKKFGGLGRMKGTNNPIAQEIASFIARWQKAHQRLPLQDAADTEGTLSILIPVDVPPISVLHTADIQIKWPGEPLTGEDHESMICVNQLLAASLSLKWTKKWDTEVLDPASLPASYEFSYEVNAPPDTWLLGGRRRGHFFVPSGSPESSDSSQETDISLVLIPLREGWLPYPSVDIRQVRPGEDEGAPRVLQLHCETDYRNLGETVHVIADRESVTLSLDASGPGGGPLVLESSRVSHNSSLVV
jgi:trafficking protein particle complex subunit 10